MDVSKLILCQFFAYNVKVATQAFSFVFIKGANTFLKQCLVIVQMCCKEDFILQNSHLRHLHLV